MHTTAWRDGDATVAPAPGGDEDGALLQGGRLAAAGSVTHRLVHDLANPLVGILGVTDRLLAASEPGSDVHAQLTLVRDSGEELRALLARFRRLFPAPSVRAPVHLDRVVREAAELVRVSDDADGVEILERYDDGGPVDASPGDLTFAALALLQNAVQAAGHGGTVRVATGGDDEVAWLTVADDGPGLDAETAERAFEPFFSTWGRAGLGLAAARAAARRTGGDVVLRRAVIGAEVRLSVPYGGRA